MDFKAPITALVARLRNTGFDFDRGLSSSELIELEQRFEIQFPPDLRFLLQTAMPRSQYHPNWREDPSILQSEFFDVVSDGLLFDVENKVLWRHEWGTRPARIEDAIETARAELVKVPKLIPICYRGFGLKCLASGTRAGTPCFSIQQSDIVHCGANLIEFLEWIVGDRPSNADEDPFPVFSDEYLVVPFWTGLAQAKAKRPPRKDLDVTVSTAFTGLAVKARAAALAAEIRAESATLNIFAPEGYPLLFWITECRGSWILRLCGVAGEHQLKDFQEACEVCEELIEKLRSGFTREDLPRIVDAYFQITPGSASPHSPPRPST